MGGCGSTGIRADLGVVLPDLFESKYKSDWFSKERKRARGPGRRARLDALIARESKHRNKRLKRVLEVPWFSSDRARTLKDRREKADN
jgi:hypothetical protein